MSERTRFIAYITKYALTDGIITKAVEDCFDTSPAMVKAVAERESMRVGQNEYYHGKDWHRSVAQAILRAEEMKAAKLKAIDKQRARIAALKFQ